MNFIRERVSGKRNRFLENGFNLDLTYIDYNIIASSLPSDGLKKIYKNNIKNIHKFLKKYHNGHFLIINLSNEAIDKKNLLGKSNINNFIWEDHRPTNIYNIFNIVSICNEYLKKDRNNVVFIHCLSGKGRTGSAIICLLIYLKKVNTVKEGLELYKNLRGVSVEHPSQIRYINYFFSILNNIGNIRQKLFYSSRAYLVRKIEILTNCKIDLKIKIYLNNHIKKLIKEIKLSKNNYTANLSEPLIICDDFFVEIYYKSFLKYKLFSFAYLNTLFIPENNPNIELNKNQMDPYKKIKKIKDFKINLILEEINVNKTSNNFNNTKNKILEIINQQ